MSSLVIAGGVYHERVHWPTWDQIFGSAGRAAAALTGHVDFVELHSYARSDTASAFLPCAQQYGFSFHPVDAEQTISFEYIHSLSTPILTPSVRRIRDNQPLAVTADNVLRFGMIEGSAIVRAQRCVYDPQSPFDPEPFALNGSESCMLAIVGNRNEISGLSGVDDTLRAAHKLREEGASVVIVKSGPDGALVVTEDGETVVPAYRTERVWTVGSGDVFAAHFAARWAAHHDDPIRAADIASRAVAEYVESMALPSPGVPTLLATDRKPVNLASGCIYLASPFFTTSQRWLVEEARQALIDLGLNVFSPVHDVGSGPAEAVAPADIAALSSCSAVFAIVDGLDSGTMFEVGYARALKKPVYALAQAVSEGDLKMIVGSDCRVFDDFVTAIYHAAWRT
jgi:nucleoside 2-deoxyribosyltransferase